MFINAKDSKTCLTTVGFLEPEVVALTTINLVVNMRESQDHRVESDPYTRSSLLINMHTGWIVGEIGISHTGRTLHGPIDRCWVCGTIIGRCHHQPSCVNTQGNSSKLAVEFHLIGVAGGAHPEF